MRSTVLVVPAGTEIGLEIGESLARSKHWDVVAGNSLRDHSEMTYRRGVFDLPFAAEAGFAEAVARTARDVGAAFVIPAHDDAIFALAGAPLGDAVFVGPDAPLAAVLRFKSATYLALRDHVPCPTVYLPHEISAADLPLFAKPDRGQGSRGARKLAGAQDLAAALSDPSLLVTEYLEGPEYTVDCFTTGAGELAYVSGRLRQRVSNGISVRAEEAADPRLAAMAARISAALGLRGAWFFQVKADGQGELKLLEVANRVSGTMGFQRERGVNLVDAWLHDLSGRAVSFIPWSFGPVVLDRALAAGVIWDYRPETVYVDFDDTLMFASGKANYTLIGQLFGLKLNLGARLVLITRHGADINEALRRLSLTELFDDIRHLTHGEPKSEAIDPGRAIFIDDSFAERAEVSKARRIPTFPVEAMACLEGLNRAALGAE